MLKRPHPLLVGQKGHADAGEREEKAHDERVEHDRPRLFGQRRSRPMSWGRRGASASHSAMASRMPRKNPRRRTGSAAIAVAGKGVSPGLDQASYTFNLIN